MSDDAIAYPTCVMQLTALATSAFLFAECLVGFIFEADRHSAIKHKANANNETDRIADVVTLPKEVTQPP